MHVVAEEMPLPISDEFGRVYEEQNLGIPIEEAMKSMCDRVPNLDLRFFVTSVGNPAANRRRPGGNSRQDRLRHPRTLPHPRPGQGPDGGRPALRRRADRLAVRLVRPHAANEAGLHLSRCGPIRWAFKMSVFALVMQIVGAICIKKIVDIKV